MYLIKYPIEYGYLLPKGKDIEPAEFPQKMTLGIQLDHDFMLNCFVPCDTSVISAKLS